ncbi:hypothetical protein BRADI_1g04359v3 [Brachypodium distachyon]|uniref:Uncharacterized protein n=1 Tax=Brachypodium distachyon TaxID=15368 RepID=A0A2K2DI28_BRADI|nr:hypothetical protein BRADI_1g04359v3 [Brachypodium distachyon]
MGCAASKNDVSVTPPVDSICAVESWTGACRARWSRSQLPGWSLSPPLPCAARRGWPSSHPAEGVSRGGVSGSSAASGLDRTGAEKPGLEDYDLIQKSSTSSEFKMDFSLI